MAGLPRQVILSRKEEPKTTSQSSGGGVALLMGVWPRFIYFAPWAKWWPSPKVWARPPQNGDEQWVLILLSVLICYCLYLNRRWTDIPLDGSFGTTVVMPDCTTEAETDNQVLLQRDRLVTSLDLTDLMKLKMKVTEFILCDHKWTQKHLPRQPQLQGKKHLPQQP